MNDYKAYIKIHKKLKRLESKENGLVVAIISLEEPDYGGTKGFNIDRVPGCNSTLRDPVSDNFENLEYLRVKLSRVRKRLIVGRKRLKVVRARIETLALMDDPEAKVFIEKYIRGIRYLGVIAKRTNFSYDYVKELHARLCKKMYS